PGMSRAGATIIGALLTGVERKTAAEFSFFLAIPVIVGATIFDVWGNRDLIGGDHLLIRKSEDRAQAWPPRGPDCDAAAPVTAPPVLLTQMA
ncbi:MAG TPA: hypothetical protein DCF73_12975, partial [Rhodobiaceae bacterium]|nr:hypothetical protein [Rhodobiaceae bacterium]